MSRKHLALLAAALLTAVATPAAAQVKIGVLSDMNSLYADITGKGTGAAARMALRSRGRGTCQAVVRASGFIAGWFQTK